MHFFSQRAAADASYSQRSASMGSSREALLAANATAVPALS
jgi:hypothetical protein